MKTITAKELRDNLGEIARRVHQGEHIKVTYREKPAFTLTPATSVRSAKSTNQKLPGLAAFDKAPSKGYAFDKNKSIKQLYHESLVEKYDR